MSLPNYGDCPGCGWIISRNDLKCGNPACLHSPNYLANALTRPHHDYVVYMSHLHKLEEAGERTTLTIGPFSAIVLIGALQLATRHPMMLPRHRDIVTSFVNQFRPWFVGTAGEQLIDLGSDPANDVPFHPQN